MRRKDELSIMKPKACMLVTCTASASTSSLSLSPLGEYDFDAVELSLSCLNPFTWVFVPLLELIISLCVSL